MYFFINRRRFNHLTSTPVEPRLAGVGPFNFRVLLSFFVSAQVQDLAFRSPLVKPVLGQRCLQFLRFRQESDL
ncbi:BnaC06g31730D [Brassica napus]|uniref:BnaC06g31730D protein n=1 Tax=Brassica napus TaxID=3708 RepID=A0A078FE96_BRANA|nr:BnaC06g31730D [Brassica napus]